MAMNLLNDFGIGDVNFTTMMETLDQLYKNNYSITNRENTTVPAIAIGSKIEVNGAYYIANSEEAISLTDPVTSSTVADGGVYICMIAAGDTATAAFTATAPTWSDAKQGFYGTGGQANYKYLDFTMTKTGSSYTTKYVYHLNQNENILIGNDGFIVTDGNIILTSGNLGVTAGEITTSDGGITAGGLTICRKGIRIISVALASGATEDTVYDFISSKIPATISESTEYLAYGHFGVSTSEILSVKRYSSTVIRLTYGAGLTKDFTNGDATAIGATLQISLPA